MSSKSGKPAIRKPQPCGHDVFPAVGREPCQLGWYEFVASRHAKASMIDVGSGVGAGIAYLRYLGAGRVLGFDSDMRLMVFPDVVIGDSPLTIFGAGACDVVTCMDVIEHVVDDLALFSELKQIATKAVYISTPNFSRSKAANHCHAREYTIAEFCNIFQPDELWVGSPDGWYHRTLLLTKRDGPNDTMIMQNELDTAYYPLGKISNDVVFNHGSPDGLVWGHYCGVFNVGVHNLTKS